MKENRNYLTLGVMVLVCLFAVVYVFQQLYTIPQSFPVGKNFTINEKESLKSVSKRLEDEGYINSPLLFRAGISFLGKDRAIKIGGYVFDKPSSLSQVIEMFVNGKPASPLLSVTIPEGSTSLETATIIAKALPTISVEIFNDLIARNHIEGKLFPSTYFLLPSYTEEDIIQLMLATFTKRISQPLQKETISLPLTNENDVLVLSSILEGEANNEVDMKIVSGILLTRLSKGMPLQVDVAKETYKQKGLPKLPLNNPGVIAINATLHPTLTDYLFYVTGDDGKMHYAKTFEEHKRNVRKYLK